MDGMENGEFFPFKSVNFYDVVGCGDEDEEGSALLCLPDILMVM